MLLDATMECGLCFVVFLPRDATHRYAIMQLLLSWLGATPTDWATVVELQWGRGGLAP